MSGLKSVIITLPAKSLTKTTPTSSSIIAGELGKPSSKLNFTTSILMDKIKMENKQQQQPKSVKHIKLSLPVVSADNVVFKQENNSDAPPKSKKRRLDHLTWEEKLQRKKLKNRVAAQTSRDRKKAKLDELEETVRLLQASHESLTEECEQLRSQNKSLVSENKKLKRDNRDLMESNKLSKEEQLCTMCQGRVDCTVPTLGSAVSPTDPLQQGGTVQTAKPLTLTPSATIILKILTLYLLSRTYLGSSKETTPTSSDLKNSRKAFCERLPLKWKQTLLSQMNRSLSKRKTLKNMRIQKQWWGRHQVMWKPVQPVPA